MTTSRPFSRGPGGLAADERVYLAMGMGTIHLGERLPLENKVVLIDPSGRIVASHLKNRPVAGWEASIMLRGDDGIPVVATDAGRMAAAICFEADFPDFIRQAADGDRTMTAQVPVGRIPTIYARTGDWFSWLCVVGLAAMLSVVMIGKAQ